MSTPGTRKNQLLKAPDILGDVESAFRQEFLQALRDGKDDDVLPFKGKLNLPTREQVVKLFVVVRNLPGNHQKPKPYIAKLVCNHVLKY